MENDDYEEDERKEDEEENLIDKDDQDKLETDFIADHMDYR